MIQERFINAHKIERSFKSRDWAVVDKRIPENLLPEHWAAARYPIEQGLEAGCFLVRSESRI